MHACLHLRSILKPNLLLFISKNTKIKKFCSSNQCPLNPKFVKSRVDIRNNYFSVIAQKFLLMYYIYNDDNAVIYKWKRLLHIYMYFNSTTFQSIKLHNIVAEKRRIISLSAKTCIMKNKTCQVQKSEQHINVIVTYMILKRRFAIKHKVMRST